MKQKNESKQSSSLTLIVSRACPYALATEMTAKMLGVPVEILYTDNIVN